MISIFIAFFGLSAIFDGERRSIFSPNKNKFDYQKSDEAFQDCNLH